MMRLSFLFAVLACIVLLLSAPMSAQYVPYLPGVVKTPEVHLGTGDQPSVVNVPPVVVVDQGVDSYNPEVGEPFYAPPLPAEPYADEMGMAEAPYFDYLISPVAEFAPGSMEDTSVSLGEYARELRSRPPGPPPTVLTPGGKNSPPESTPPAESTP